MDGETNKRVMTIQEAYDMALVAHRNGNFKDASILYQSLLQKYPNNAELLSLIGNLAFKNQQFNLAIDFMRLAIEAAPNEIVHYLSLARVFILTGDFKNATKVYEELIARNFGMFSRF